MKNYLVITLLLFFSTTILAQQSDMQMKMSSREKPVELLSGLGSLHHPTSTKNAEAQRYFDQVCLEECGYETEHRRSLSWRGCDR